MFSREVKRALRRVRESYETCPYTPEQIQQIAIELATMTHSAEDTGCDEDSDGFGDTDLNVSSSSQDETDWSELPGTSPLQGSVDTYHQPQLLVSGCDPPDLTRLSMKNTKNGDGTSNVPSKPLPKPAQKKKAQTVNGGNQTLTTAGDKTNNTSKMSSNPPVKLRELSVPLERLPQQVISACRGKGTRVGLAHGESGPKVTNKENVVHGTRDWNVNSDKNTVSVSLDVDTPARFSDPLLSSSMRLETLQASANLETLYNSMPIEYNDLGQTYGNAVTVEYVNLDQDVLYSSLEKHTQNDLVHMSIDDAINCVAEHTVVETSSEVLRMGGDDVFWNDVTSEMTLKSQEDVLSLGIPEHYAEVVQSSNLVEEQQKLVEPQIQENPNSILPIVLPPVTVTPTRYKVVAADENLPDETVSTAGQDSSEPSTPLPTFQNLSSHILHVDTTVEDNGISSVNSNHVEMPKIHSPNPTRNRRSKLWKNRPMKRSTEHDMIAAKEPVSKSDLLEKVVEQNESSALQTCPAMDLPPMPTASGMPPAAVPSKGQLRPSRPKEGGQKEFRPNSDTRQCEPSGSQKILDRKYDEESSVAFLSSPAKQTRSQVAQDSARSPSGKGLQTASGTPSKKKIPDLLAIASRELVGKVGQELGPSRTTRQSKMTESQQKDGEQSLITPSSSKAKRKNYCPKKLNTTKSNPEKNRGSGGEGVKSMSRRLNIDPLTTLEGNMPVLSVEDSTSIESLQLSTDSCMPVLDEQAAEASQTTVDANDIPVLSGTTPMLSGATCINTGNTFQDSEFGNTIPGDLASLEGIESRRISTSDLVPSIAGISTQGEETVSLRDAERWLSEQLHSSRTTEEIVQSLITWPSPGRKTRCTDELASQNVVQAVGNIDPRSCGNRGKPSTDLGIGDMVGEASIHAAISVLDMALDASNDISSRGELAAIDVSIEQHSEEMTKSSTPSLEGPRATESIVQSSVMLESMNTAEEQTNPTVDTEASSAGPGTFQLDSETAEGSFSNAIFNFNVPETRPLKMRRWKSSGKADKAIDKAEISNNDLKLTISKVKETSGKDKSPTYRIRNSRWGCSSTNNVNTDKQPSPKVAHRPEPQSRLFDNVVENKRLGIELLAPETSKRKGSVGRFKEKLNWCDQNMMSAVAKSTEKQTWLSSSACASALKAHNLQKRKSPRKVIFLHELPEMPTDTTDQAQDEISLDATGTDSDMVVKVQQVSDNGSNKTSNLSKTYPEQMTAKKDPVAKNSSLVQKSGRKSCQSAAAEKAISTGGESEVKSDKCQPSHLPAESLGSYRILKGRYLHKKHTNRLRRLKQPKRKLKQLKKGKGHKKADPSVVSTIEIHLSAESTGDEVISEVSEILADETVYDEIPFVESDVVVAVPVEKKLKGIKKLKTSKRKMGLQTKGAKFVGSNPRNREKNPLLENVQLQVEDLIPGGNKAEASVAEQSIAGPENPKPSEITNSRLADESVCDEIPFVESDVEAVPVKKKLKGVKKLKSSKCKMGLKKKGIKFGGSNSRNRDKNPSLENVQLLSDVQVQLQVEDLIPGGNKAEASVAEQSMVGHENPKPSEIINSGLADESVCDEIPFVESDVVEALPVQKKLKGVKKLKSSKCKMGLKKKGTKVGGSNPRNRGKYPSLENVQLLSDVQVQLQVEDLTTGEKKAEASVAEQSIAGHENPNPSEIKNSRLADEAVCDEIPFVESDVVEALPVQKKLKGVKKLKNSKRKMGRKKKGTKFGGSNPRNRDKNPFLENVQLLSDVQVQLQVEDLIPGGNKAEASVAEQSIAGHENPNPSEITNSSDPETLSNPAFKGIGLQKLAKRRRNGTKSRKLPSRIRKQTVQKSAKEYLSIGRGLKEDLVFYDLPRRSRKRTVKIAAGNIVLYVEEEKEDEPKAIKVMMDALKAAPNETAKIVHFRTRKKHFDKSTSDVPPEIGKLSRNFQTDQGNFDIIELPDAVQDNVVSGSTSGTKKRSDKKSAHISGSTSGTKKPSDKKSAHISGSTSGTKKPSDKKSTHISGSTSGTKKRSDKKSVHISGSTSGTKKPSDKKSAHISGSTSGTEKPSDKKSAHISGSTSGTKKPSDKKSVHFSKEVEGLAQDRVTDKGVDNSMDMIKTDETVRNNGPKTKKRIVKKSVEILPLEKDMDKEFDTTMDMSLAGSVQDETVGNKLSKAKKRTVKKPVCSVKGVTRPVTGHRGIEIDHRINMTLGSSVSLLEDTVGKFSFKAKKPTVRKSPRGAVETSDRSTDHEESIVVHAIVHSPHVQEEKTKKSSKKQTVGNSTSSVSDDFESCFQDSEMETEEIFSAGDKADFVQDETSLNVLSNAKKGTEKKSLSGASKNGKINQDTILTANDLGADQDSMPMSITKKRTARKSTRGAVNPDGSFVRKNITSRFDGIENLVNVFEEKSSVGLTVNSRALVSSPVNVFKSKSKPNSIPRKISERKPPSATIKMENQTSTDITQNRDASIRQSLSREPNRQIVLEEPASRNSDRVAFGIQKNGHSRLDKTQLRSSLCGKSAAKKRKSTPEDSVRPSKQPRRTTSQVKGGGEKAAILDELKIFLVDRDSKATLVKYNNKQTLKILQDLETLFSLKLTVLPQKIVMIDKTQKSPTMTSSDIFQRLSEY